MKVQSEFLDLETLDIIFDLPKLIGFHDKMVKMKNDMESALQKATAYGDLLTQTRIKTELFYITTNIENVLTVISIKEGDLFEFEHFELICKN